MKTNNVLKNILLKSLPVTAAAGVFFGSASLLYSAPENAEKSKTEDNAEISKIVFQPTFRSNLPSAETFEDSENAAKLLKARETLINNMLQTRTEIIRSDARAKDLHKQIVELNKKLSTVIENKRSMQKLNRELNALDGKINQLKKKASSAAAPAPRPASTDAKN